ncbi:MAG TPA: hypothetical protein VM344_06290 [Vitreimonas sp.]|nr:hypothetical protein [Vitreimonas sp.]
MHPIRHPRYAILVGIGFVALAAVYYAAPALFGGHLDWSGVVMLGALGIAMGLMAYVLIAGSPND